MWRDVKDVLTSCFHYYNAAPKEEFPHAEDFSTFIRLDPTQFTFDAAYSLRKASNMVSRWENHVVPWLEQKSRIHIVQYEQLKNAFEQVIEEIADTLGSVSPQTAIMPTLRDRNIAPRIGLVGDWQNHFTKEDRAFIETSLMQRI